MELRCKKVRYQLKDDDGLNNTGFLLCMTDCQAIDNCVMDGLSFIFFYPQSHKISFCYI